MARRKKHQASLWPDGADLPLFSGVCMAVRFQPFKRASRPPIPYLQLRFDVLLSPLLFEELAERFRAWAEVPLPAEDPTKPRLL